MNIQPIIDEISKKPNGAKTYLIAIDGRSGSGKSYLAKKLSEVIPNVTIISLDEFDLYEGDLNIQKVINEVIEPIKHEQGNKITLLEGIFSLNSKLESYYDLKIWVECTAETGYKRGLQRDKELNGIDNSDKWINYWLPKEEEYIQTEKPQKKADFIIDGSN